jgi:Acetyltransferase (GNAT) domain
MGEILAIENQKLESWKHQDEHAFLLIGTRQTYGPVLEKILVASYLQMEKDGTVHASLTGMDMNLTKFLGLFDRRQVLIGLEKETNKVVGLGWLWAVEGQPPATKASIAYCFFKEFWGGQAIKSLARLSIDFWFNELGVNVLFGSIVDSNRLALRFCKNLGFKTIIDVPYMFSTQGAFEHGMLVIQTKEEWLKRAETMSG